ncbi:MAG: hypothetical protein HY791_32095 [Deltaproteobacteria bacterium]|nr:hypothetical protein [Deltaproteobacteria bacterium]
MATRDPTQERIESIARLRRLGIEANFVGDGSVRGSLDLGGRSLARPEGVRVGSRHDFALHGDSHFHFLPPSPLRLLGLVKFVGARNGEHLLKFVEASWNSFAARTTQALARARSYFSDATFDAESWQIVARLKSPRLGELELVYYEDAARPKVAVRRAGGKVVEPAILVSLPTDPPSVAEALRLIFQATKSLEASKAASGGRESSRSHFSAVFSVPTDLEESLPEDERIPQDALSGSFVIGPDGFLENDAEPEPRVIDSPLPDPSEPKIPPRAESATTGVFPRSPFFDDDQTDAPMPVTVSNAWLPLPSASRVVLQAGFHRVEARVTHANRFGLYGQWLGRRPQDGQIARLVGQSAFSPIVKVAPPTPIGDATLKYHPDPAFAESQDAKGVLIAMRPGTARDRALVAALDRGALVLPTPTVIALCASAAMIHVRLFVLDPRLPELARWPELGDVLSLDERGRALVVSESGMATLPPWARWVHPRSIGEAIAEELKE